MGNVAVVTDSNSGISLGEAKTLGIAIVPMPFLIDGEVYYEDIDLSQEQFYEMLGEELDISTSQPAPDFVMQAWEEALKNADEVVYIPMSSGLSGSCETAMMMSEDFEGRVHVVDNCRISVTQRQSVLDALSLAQKGKSGREIKTILEQVKMESSIYIMLDTLKYLRRGGRITAAAAALGTALKLKPVLQIQGEKLDAFAIARTRKQGALKMMSAIEEDLNNRFGGDAKKLHIAVAHTQNQEAAEALQKALIDKFGVEEVVVCPLSLSVSCHIGPGALAIACSKEI